MSIEKNEKSQSIWSSRYIPKDKHLICSICGFKIRASEARRNENGSWVCFTDYDGPHPQERIRHVKEKITPDKMNPEPETGNDPTITSANPVTHYTPEEIENMKPSGSGGGGIDEPEPDPDPDPDPEPTWAEYTDDTYWGLYPYVDGFTDYGSWNSEESRWESEGHSSYPNDVHVVGLVVAGDWVDGKTVLSIRVDVTSAATIGGQPADANLVIDMYQDGSGDWTASISPHQVINGECTVTFDITAYENQLYGVVFRTVKVGSSTTPSFHITKIELLS